MGGMGPSSDGTGWVNDNNTCKGDDCDQRMSLPESHGKYCTKCGTRVPTWEEMQAGPKPRIDLWPARPKVQKPRTCLCGARPGSMDKFCTECGMDFSKLFFPPGVHLRGKVSAE